MIGGGQEFQRILSVPRVEDSKGVEGNAIWAHRHLSEEELLDTGDMLLTLCSAR